MTPERIGHIESILIRTMTKEGFPRNVAEEWVGDYRNKYLLRWDEDHPTLAGKDDDAKLIRILAHFKKTVKRPARTWLAEHKALPAVSTGADPKERGKGEPDPEPTVAAVSDVVITLHRKPDGTTEPVNMAGDTPAPDWPNYLRALLTEAGRDGIKPQALLTAAARKNENLLLLAVVMWNVQPTYDSSGTMVSEPIWTFGEAMEIFCEACRGGRLRVPGKMTLTVAGPTYDEPMMRRIIERLGRAQRRVRARSV
jgi:hypothetical protein